MNCVKIMDIYSIEDRIPRGVWELKLYQYNVNEENREITLSVSTEEAIPVIEEWFNQIVTQNGIFRENQQYAKKGLNIIEENGVQRLFKDVVPLTRVLPVIGVQNIKVAYSEEIKIPVENQAAKTSSHL